VILAPALLACAANVAPVTLETVVGVESQGDPLAILDNRTHRSWHLHDPGQAIALAQRLVAARHRVDIGLMQVDSDNLPALGLSVAQAFDRCTNVRAGGTILTADYAAARQRWGEGQIALQHALAAYNTGSFYRGAAYVARYYGRAAVPAVHFDMRIAKVDKRDSAPIAALGGRQHMARRPSETTEPRARLSAPRSHSTDDSVYRLAAVNISIR
jgi:type IV secretion system protein VirB1